MGQDDWGTGGTFDKDDDDDPTEADNPEQIRFAFDADEDDPPPGDFELDPC